MAAVIGAGLSAGDSEYRERLRTELDALHADYLSRLGDHRSLPRGAAYSRFSTRFQESIADQFREILESALTRGIYIAREHLFFDAATSGKKQRRSGMTELQQVLASKQVRFALFFSTSRAFRNRSALSDFVEQATQEWKCHCIFTTQNLDTLDSRSEFMLGFLGMMDEYFTNASVAHIQSAHVGLLDDALVFGTETYGYGGVPVEGLTTRRGRPKRKLVIDPITAAVVLFIFRWYVEDRLTIEEIARRLNSMPEHPLPVKATVGWTPTIVKRILRNERYRGLWSYGKTSAQYLRKQDYTRQQARETPLRQKALEHLRIVSDELWYAAQARLVTHARPSGRPPAANSEKPRRPRFIEGLLYCPTHDRPLLVSGAYGKRLCCPDCRRMFAKDRPLFSLVPRKLAERVLLDYLAQAVTCSESIIDRLVEACEQAVDAAAVPDPVRIKDLERRVSALTTRIQFNRSNVGETPEEQADADQMIRELGRQRSGVQAELNALRSVADNRPPALSRDDVLDRMRSLHTAMAQLHLDQHPDLVLRLRRVLELITGGRIDLEQCGERQEKKGWLAGTFRPRLLDWLLGKPSIDEPSLPSSEVVRLEFKAEPAWIVRAQQVVKLIESGVQPAEAAAQLKMKAPSVIKLYRRWYQHHGLPTPAAFARMSRKPASEQSLPRYQQIAETVQRLLEEGWPMQEIARMCQVDRNTVTAAVKYLAKKRGEHVLDGRARRKQLRLQREQDGESPEKSS